MQSFDHFMLPFHSYICLWLFLSHVLGRKKAAKGRFIPAISININNLSIEDAHSNANMTDKIKYTQVDDNASDDGLEYQKPVRRQRGWIATLSSFLLGLVTMGAFMALYSAFITPEMSHARNLPQAREGSDPDTGLPLSWSHGDCGNSPEDAKSAWMPIQHRSSLMAA